MIPGRDGVAFRERSDRRFLEVSGRAPSQMLSGVVTGTVPPGLRPRHPSVWTGRAEYSLLLTPKGRTVSDLRLVRLDEGGGDTGPGAEAGPVGAPAVVPGRSDGSERLLLELPAAGAPGAVEHLARFIPPRFATVRDVSEAWGVLTVLGPEGPELVSREALGLRVEAPELRAMEEGDLLAVEAGGDDRILVTPHGGVAVPALDLLAPAAVTGALAERMAELEVPSLGAEGWDVLRVEAGRPAFGVDFDDSVLPVEAGVHDRAIDYEKGCYTGQEVIVRIRDRGRVNRHLRGLVPVDGSEVLPEPREELRPAGADDGARAVGWITSSVRSPLHGPLALGYVRREVEPGGRVRSDSGVELRVVELGEGWPPA